MEPGQVPHDVAPERERLIDFVPSPIRCFRIVTPMTRLMTVALLIAARPVYAQPPPPQPVSQILPNLFGNTIVLTPTGTPEFPNHSAHFKPGAEQLQTPIRFNEQIVTLLATLPVGSSSGGSPIPSTPRWDPSAGAARASAPSTWSGR